MMRSVCSAAATVLFLTMAGSSLSYGQNASGLAITNIQFVSAQLLAGSKFLITYRADVVNTGIARPSVAATVTSLVSTVQVVTGQDTLHFPPVPANGQATSINTFTILADSSVFFLFSDLQWNFVAPVANAGPNQTAPVGTTITLNAGGSSDANGGTLTYAWSFVSRPAGSAAVLTNPNTVMAAFVIDAPGNYVVKVTVDNGVGQGSATVTVSTINSPPVAKAGPNRTVAMGATVTLDGSGSSDVDGDPLSYFWSLVSQPPGSSATVANAHAVVASFVADKPGSYVAQLMVNDGKVNGAPATVTITTNNTPPVANPGPNQVVGVGALVQLNGSASTDVDGDVLSYKWALLTVPDTSLAKLSDPSAVNPTFTADLGGTYVAQLIVNDGKIDSAPATVMIVTNWAQPPTANPGPNQTVVHGSTVTLSGSGTDPQHLRLSFLWSLTTRPAGSSATLSNANSPTPSFVADKPGNYVAQLIVSNAYLTSPPVTVSITTTNTPPVADAGQNQNVGTATTVTLNGGGSSDADHDPLTYKWSFTKRPAGSTTALSAATSQTPTFFADVAGTYVAQLIVNDGYADSAPTTVTITATLLKITLIPDTLNLFNAPGTLSVNLSGPAPGPDGVVVGLHFDAAVISAPSSVIVAANTTGVNVTVTPVGTGTSGILATAAGYQAGGATVSVTMPSIQVALSASGVGVTRTIGGTITLSAPTPPGANTIVTLSAGPSGSLAFNSPTVTFAPGTITGTFNLTGLAPGSATVTASSPGYTSGSAGVLVAQLGAIALAQGVIVAPGQSAAMEVRISNAAPAGGVTIALISSDPSKLTVTTSVFIPGGATAPAAPPQVTGVDFGSATITASAGGYRSDTETVTVAPTLAFSPSALTMTVGANRNLILTLSSPAPGGLAITLTSENSASVRVPSSVLIPPNSNSTTVAVSALAAGSAVIRASAPNFADGIAIITVQGGFTASRVQQPR